MNFSACFRQYSDNYFDGGRTMKKFLCAMMAVCLTFAMISCGGDEPTTGDDKITISYNLNWPTGNSTPAPNPPAAVKIANGGTLSTAQLGYTGTTPSGYYFAGWFLTKPEADGATQAGRVLVTTTFSENKVIVARWEVITLDTSGKDVEKITLANNYYPVYQFTLPSGKKWSDYKNISFDVAMDEANFTASVAGFRIYGNYTLDDFTFLTGTGADVLGKKVGVALTNNDDIELNKNGPYIMHNDTTDANPQSRANANGGTGGSVMEWFTLNQKDFADVDPHNQFKNDPISNRNMPADAATGPFYLGVGLPNLTYWAKNVRLVGKTGTADVVGVPLIVSTTVPGTDTAATVYRVFCPGYGTTSGSDGLREISREFTNTSGNSSPVPHTIADNRATVIFDYNYPASTLTQPTEADRTKSTDLNGRLGDTLANLTGEDVPAGYKFLGWFSAATGGDAITASQGFAAGSETTIYGHWDEVLIGPPSRPLVIEGSAIEFSMFGSNNKATYEGGVATYVSGTTDGNAVKEGQWGLMTTTTFSNSFGGGGYNSLAAVKFPAATEDYLYTKVIITYETAIPTSIVGTSTVTPLTEGTTGMATTVKKAFNTWSGDVGYPTLETGVGSYTADFDKFSPGTGEDPGFSIQQNTYQQTPADGFLIRFTKIEFTTQELIDAGPIEGPEVSVFGNAALPNGEITLLGSLIKVNNLKTRTNMGFCFVLPEGWEDATTIAVDYDIDITTGPAKFTLKAGLNSFDNITAPNATLYQETNTSGAGTFECPVTGLYNAAGTALLKTDNGLSFQINTWGDADADLVMKFDIKIVQIRLIP
jgi:hypothetical protein